MEHLLHDLRLPGFGFGAHAGQPSEASPSTNGHHKRDQVTASSSLLQFLNDSSRAVRRLDSNADRHADSNEWQEEVLRLKLRQAKTYTEWLSAASELDRLEGNEIWKTEEDSAEYDVPLVRVRMQQLEDARISCDAGRMLHLVRTSLTRDLGGMGDLCLYKHCRVGTKALIERYIEAALDTLEALVELSPPSTNSNLDTREVYEQLLEARQAFGRSALLLSGGGTLGMNHIGVVKSLFEAQLLPRIISGASAGSIIAAVLCTRSDDEIPQVLRDFCYGDLTVFDKAGEEEGVLKKAFRFLTKGALFDISNLVRVMRELLGDLTFQEAYNRTRRILNICVSTASLYELPRLLNYVTAPNVMIWSAVATSCSVPFVFSPAQLLAKDPRTGKEVPWDQSPQRWIDGSVDNDLPMTRLAEMFNVNHFIVCQVNPHVVPFLERDEELVSTETSRSKPVLAAGSSLLRTLAELAKDEALHRMHVLSELGFMPTAMSKMRSVLSQRYSGDITILPEVAYAHFPRVLTNPSSEFMIQAMLSGERATWPKLTQVRNHCAIELALDAAVQNMRTRLVFSPSQIDLRLNAFGKPDSLHLGGSEKRRQKRRASHNSPTSHGTNLSAVRHTHRIMSLSIYDRSHADKIKDDMGSSSSDVESGPSSAGEEYDNSEELLSSSSSDLPSSPRELPSLWPPPRQLFPSRSQPATPSGASRAVLLSNSQTSLGMTSTPTIPEANGPEREYKQIFHRPKVADLPVIETQLFQASPHNSLDLDVSGTRGMVRRRRSLSTAGIKGFLLSRRH